MGLIKCIVPCNIYYMLVHVYIYILFLLLPSHESVLRVEAIICLMSAGLEG